MTWLYQPLLPAAADLSAAAPLATAYWVGGTGTWDETTPTNWASTSGGAGGAGYPDQNSTVIFDSNSNVGTGTFTVTINGGLCNNLTISSLDGAMTLAPTTSGLTVYGSASIPTTNLTITGDAAIVFAATTSKTITSNGTTWNCPITFNGVGGTWQLVDNLTIGATRTTTLTNGTIDLNGKTLSTGSVSLSNSNSRSITSTTPAQITISNTTGGTVWEMTSSDSFTGSNNITVDITGNNAVTKTINLGALAEGNSFNFTVGGNGTTIAFLAGSFVNNLTITNSTCTLANTVLNIYGNFLLSGTNPTLTAGINFNFKASSAKTITTSGSTIDGQLSFEGSGGTWALQDNLTQGATRTTYHSNGTINLNGKTFTVGASYYTDLGTKNITFNGGTLVCPAATTTAFNNAAPSGFTTTAGTGTGKISMTGATIKTFVGGGSTYNCTLENAGAGPLVIDGSNSFTDISNSIHPAVFRFISGTTTTVTNFSVSGTPGNLATIRSHTLGSPATLSKSSGTVSVSYCSIRDLTATGGATWQAYTTNGNEDLGGNTGWLFAVGSTYVTIDTNVILGSGILISF